MSGLFFKFDILILSIIFYIGIYIIENLRKPIGISYVTETINKDILATVLSAESQAHTLIAAILAPVIGFFADRFGLGFGLVSVSLLLILISPLVFINRRK